MTLNFFKGVYSPSNYYSLKSYLSVLWTWLDQWDMPIFSYRTSYHIWWQEYCVWKIFIMLQFNRFLSLYLCQLANTILDSIFSPCHTPTIIIINILLVKFALYGAHCLLNLYNVIHTHKCCLQDQAQIAWFTNTRGVC